VRAIAVSKAVSLIIIFIKCYTLVPLIDTIVEH
jgi:hypothetical protein